jgi:hypothetical protein
MTDRIDYADRARRVLEAIEIHKDNFDMYHWVFFEGELDALEPNADPECGTTLCVAGWAAHLDGWRIRRSDSLAEKNGIVRPIANVGLQFLGLKSDDIFFDSDEEVAKTFLRELAKGRPESEVYEEYATDTGVFGKEETFVSPTPSTSS